MGIMNELYTNRKWLLPSVSALMQTAGIALAESLEAVGTLQVLHASYTAQICTCMKLQSQRPPCYEP